MPSIQQSRGRLSRLLHLPIRGAMAASPARTAFLPE